MGCSNVGKSTFINRLIDIYRGPKDKKVTTSPIPGTTLNLISLPIGEKSYLYDTPGIFNVLQISNHLNVAELKKILPKKKVKPRVYRISGGKTLFFGGLARFDYIEGPLAYFTVFTSNELNHHHKTSLERADDLYERQLGGILIPPYVVREEIKLTEQKEWDLEGTL